MQVPDGVELVASQVSGDVEARDLHSDVTANSVSGDVFVSTTGVAEAHTVSGSLDIEMGSLDWKRLDFKTVSGDITLRLPEGLATDVDFESLSGDLDSDFDMKLQGRHERRWVGARVRGTIGDGGGRSLTLNTVSGDVNLRRVADTAPLAARPRRARTFAMRADVTVIGGGIVGLATAQALVQRRAPGPRGPAGEGARARPPSEHAQFAACCTRGSSTSPAPRRRGWPETASGA